MSSARGKYFVNGVKWFAIVKKKTCSRHKKLRNTFYRIPQSIYLFLNADDQPIKKTRLLNPKVMHAIKIPSPGR